MARIDEEPDERDQAPLVLSELQDCPECGTTQDVDYVCPEGIYELEDVVEAPSTTTTCVHCAHEWQSEYSGWTVHQDAG